MDFRVGTGYDVHRFAKDRKLIVCGVEIEHEEGLLGHSDADVAIHALIDALCGAACIGDIGKLFPDNDQQYKGISSRILLDMSMKLLRERGWELNNADITIVAQAPKFAPHIEKMRQTLADTMHCDKDRISVKATTTEHLGFTGRKEGIASYAAVTIVKK